MKQTFILAALAMAMAGAPATAQPVAADLLPAYEVNTIIASMGMRPVGRPAWMRGRYVVAAIDRYGRDVNVVLDARDGQVLAVRPLGRRGFGPPPPGYMGQPGPYGPSDGRMPPPDMEQGAPPEDEEYYDNDRQQGALPPSRPVARAAPPRDPAITGRVTRNAPVTRDAAPKDTTPVPRPRPSIARANDPGNRPASTDKPAGAAATPAEPKAAERQKPAQAEAKAEVKPDASKSEAKPESKPGSKSESKTMPARQDAKSGAAKPEASKSEAAAKPETVKPDVRVIDLSKPKTAPKPDDKPGEVIRF